INQSELFMSSIYIDDDIQRDECMKLFKTDVNNEVMYDIIIKRNERFIKRLCEKNYLSDINVLIKNLRHRYSLTSSNILWLISILGDIISHDILHDYINDNDEWRIYFNKYEIKECCIDHIAYKNNDLYISLKKFTENSDLYYVLSSLDKTYIVKNMENVGKYYKKYGKCGKIL